MKDHPLFNDDPNDTERRSRNIDFINIHQFVNGKRQIIPNQFEADQLLTVADVFEHVGAGNFELIGRENDRKRVVDRSMLTIKPLPGTQATSTTAPRTETTPTPVTPNPVMNLGNIQIPPGMDPTMSMMLVLMHTSQQQMAAMLAAQRADSQAFMAAQQQLMLGLASNNTNLITGLLSGIGSMVSGGSGGSSTDRTAEAFIKGIETMTDLHAGIQEGQEGGKPTDWATVSSNIVQGIRTLKDVAAITNAPIAPTVSVPNAS